MNTYVCVSVCLSARISPEPHARSVPLFFACCLWPWLGPPPAGWRNPRGRGSFGVFFLTDKVFYSTAFGTHTKTAEPIEMPFGLLSGLGPWNSVTWGDDPRRGRAVLGGNVPDKPNTAMNYELDWFIQRRAQDTGRRLTASVGRVYLCYRPRRRGCGVAHSGRSLISTIALDCFVNTCVDDLRITAVAKVNIKEVVNYLASS